MPTVNKEALVTQVSDKTGLTKVDANKAVTAIADSIMEAVAAGSKVTLIGFGTFERKTQAPRTARNPKTGETIHVPEKQAPKFSPGKAFKEQCNS